jgi:hypothetical protein
MDEVIGRVDVPQRFLKRKAVEDVPGHNLRRRPDLGSHLFRMAGQASQLHTPPFERGDESPSDIPATAGQQDGRFEIASAWRHRDGFPGRYDAEGNRELPIMNRWPGL